MGKEDEPGVAAQLHPTAIATPAHSASSLDAVEARRVLSFPSPPDGAAAVSPVAAALAFRISPGGILMDGEAPPELVDSVAYAALLAETAGDLMGVDGFTSLEIMLSTGACCVVGREASGSLIAMTAPRGQGIDGSELRRRMGLP